MAETIAQAVRQLKIKTGVVKRLFKEEQIYQKETKEAEANLDKLKAEGADGADIRNAERVVKDSAQMIPRTHKSLEEAVEALEDLVNALHHDQAIAETEEFRDAFSELQQIQAAWRSDGN